MSTDTAASRAQPVATDPGARGPSLWRVLVGDGRPMLLTVAMGITFGGVFAIFLALRGEFLPHDVAYLGVTAEQLREVADGRVVDFMLHDRLAWGGALMALGLLYVWLVAFPLSRGEAWAWWTLVLSGSVGFATFLTWLGYGYLDTWHGWGTIALGPLSVLGAWRSQRALVGGTALGDLRPVGRIAGLPDDVRPGWQVFALVAIGLVAVGAIITTIGIDAIFVPEDIDFIGLTRAELDAANPRLVSVIAHDRAGFGAAILVGGLVATASILHAAGERSLHQALSGAAVLAFGTAIGVHFLVGYTDPIHLAPAVAGATAIATGLWLARPSRPRM